MGDETITDRALQATLGRDLLVTRRLAAGLLQIILQRGSPEQIEIAYGWLHVMARDQEEQDAGIGGLRVYTERAKGGKNRMLLGVRDGGDKAVPPAPADKPLPNEAEPPDDPVPEPKQ